MNKCFENCKYAALEKEWDFLHIPGDIGFPIKSNPRLVPFCKFDSPNLATITDVSVCKVCGDFAPKGEELSAEQKLEQVRQTIQYSEGCLMANIINTIKAIVE